MPEQTTSQLMAEIAELDQQIAQFDNQFPWEELGNAAQQAESVDNYLGSVIEGIGEAGEQIDEQFEDFSEAADLLDGLLGDSEFTDFLGEVQEEFVDPVKGGLESSTNILEEVQGGVEKFKEFVEILQLGEGLTSDDAQEQLETAAEAFEFIVGKLEPFIDKMPVIGTFIQLWGLGIKRAAEIAGVLTEIVAEHNDTFSSIEGNEGQYLYWTDEALRDKRYRDLVNRRGELMDQALNSARSDRDATEPLDDGKAAPYEIVVESALQNSADARPDINSQAYKDWVASSRALEAADGERTEAYGAYLDEKGKLADANFALDSAGDTGADTSLEDARDSQAGAVERAEANLEQKNAAFDKAAASHREATAAHRAEGQAYDEAVKTEIHRLNEYEQLSDDQLDLLRLDYPQWDIRGWQPSEPISMSAPPAAPPSNGKRRAVMIGGGGILGIGMVLGGFFIFNGDSDTPQQLQTAPQAQVEEAADPVEKTAGGAEVAVDEPAEESAVDDAGDADDSDDAGTETAADSDATESGDTEESAGEDGTATDTGEAALPGETVIHVGDAAGDEMPCDDPADTAGGPGADIIGMNVTLDGDALYTHVIMNRSPLASTQDFSWAVLIFYVTRSGGQFAIGYEMHDRVLTTGYYDVNGTLHPDSVTTSVGEGGVVLATRVDLSDPIVDYHGQAFNMTNDGSGRYCDEIFADGFESGDTSAWS